MTFPQIRSRIFLTMEVIEKGFDIIKQPFVSLQAL